MDTTSNKLTDPCSFSSSSSPLWDVFLSFYGKDTRRNFIAHLYFALDRAGVLTFRDDHALEKGEGISSGLGHAIKNSKKFVVVLSEHYACSPWCLNELVEILDCKRTKNHVVPVFYYINPSDLRHQKGSFEKAFDSHKKYYSVHMIDKWKSALAEISELTGYHLKKDGNRDESDIVQEIVENVAPQAPTKVLHLEEYLFGIEFAVDEIYQKLSIESNDVRVIGICGMGGIGKTTTAKAFYNRYSNKFDISCFIENVKQNLQEGGSLIPFLKQLFIDLLGRKDYKVSDFESGIRRLKQICFSKKSLVVLDDLDQLSHSELLVRLCKMFSPGSRIIITTRDVNLLNQLKVDISEVDTYMVKSLGQTESLELFSYHAFRKPVPPQSFKELSLNFVIYAGGLPLALKLLGSSLRGRTQAPFWKAKLEKIREVPEKELQKILQLSYDELGDETEKAVFIDIVFFFIGKDRDEAAYIFKSCHFFPDAAIPILEERCLLTVDKNNKFQMHNLIRDMGRELGKNRHLLWRGNAWEDLQNLEGTDKTEGLVLSLTKRINGYFNAEIFERMPNLRLLQINHASDISGNFANLFQELRYISWRHCQWTQLPSSFRAPNLVILDMPFSGFKTLWKGAMPLLSLKIINISYSKNLITTPDFSNLKLVERLILRGCRSLRRVHSSIGQLINLSYVDLFDCQSLERLPESIAKLTKMDHMDLYRCRGLKRLPEAIKQLSNLGCLKLSHCQNLQRLPEQLGDMKGLKMLNASYTALEELPNSIASLKHLVDLKLYSCTKLRKLPEQLGNVVGLRTFDACLSAIKHLPDSFERLTNLDDLQLSYCKNLTSLPNNIWKLKLLKVLDLRGSSKLEQLPEKLGKMQCLEKLEASLTAIAELPDSIGLLSRLRVLDVSYCKKLRYVPDSIWNLSSLTKLYLDHNDVMRNLPDSVKDMKTMEFLYLSCNLRSWLPKIQCISSLKTLHLTDEGQSFSSTIALSLSKLSQLEYLRLYGCTSLGSSFPELPLSLQQLHVHNHTSLEKLPDLSSFTKLKRMDIFKCTSLHSLASLPPHLQRLSVSNCSSLQNVLDLSMQKELIHLDLITNNSNLRVTLKDSSLQVGRHESSFRATIPNKEIAEWIEHKSNGRTVSLDIAPNLGDKFLGIALWVVYKCKKTTCFPYIRAVITNKTAGITENYDIPVTRYILGEVQSSVECIRRETISVISGDNVTVSFQRLLYSSCGRVKVPTGEVKVEICGAHVIQKTPCTPCI